jgi:site-specific recombinase XerC
MLFDWLVVGQIVPSNPASAVRGPKHVVKTSKTPVLEAEEWRKLLDSIPATAPKYYGDDELRMHVALEEIANAGGSFLVAVRSTRRGAYAR